LIETTRKKMKQSSVEQGVSENREKGDTKERALLHWGRENEKKKDSELAEQETERACIGHLNLRRELEIPVGNEDRRGKKNDLEGENI